MEVLENLWRDDQRIHQKAMEMNIKTKAIKSVIWNILSAGIVQCCQIVISIILARLLNPELFGAYTILIMLNGFFHIFIEGGLNSSLIKHKDVDIKDYSTVFTFQLLIGFLSYFLLFLFSPSISLFFNSIVTPVHIQFSAILLIVKSMYSLHELKLIKELNFKLLAKINIFSNAISGVIAIYLAIHNFEIWALITMMLLQSSIYCLLLKAMVKMPLKFMIYMPSFKKHFRFGYFLMLSGLIDSIYQQVYQIIIGKYYSLSQLAYYNRTNTYLQLPIQMVINPINQVSFPFLSNFSEDKVKLKEYYKRILVTTFFLVTPILLISNVLIDHFVILILTEKWIHIVPYFHILVIVSLMYPLHYFNLNILKVIGRTDIFFKLEVLKKIIILVSILISFPMGLNALLWSQVINSGIFLFLNSFLSKKLISYTLINQCKDLIPVILLNLCTFGICLLCRKGCIFFELSDFLLLSCCGSLSLCFYFFMAYILKYESISEIVNFKKIYDTGNQDVSTTDYRV